MCRWIAYHGVPVPLAEYLFEPEYSLVAQSIHARKSASAVNGDGFGVGWYGAHPEPGLFRDVRPAWGDDNLRSLARHIESPLFLAHVRASTGSETSRVNCHPFAHRALLFMHNGQVDGYATLRRPLEALLPDDLYRERRGTTDSEVLFLLLVHLGLASDPGAACARLIDTVLSLMREHGVDGAFRLSFAFADGDSLYALRFATDGPPPTVYFWVHERGCVVVSEPLDGRRDHWDELPAGVVMRVAANGHPRMQELD